MEKTISKYETELHDEDDQFKVLRIGGLHSVSRCNEWLHYGFTCGSCALIKHSEYNGYCTLCRASSYLDDNLYHIELEPLYNEYGNKILIRYDHNEVFVILETVMPENYGKPDDVFIKIPKRGCCSLLDTL